MRAEFCERGASRKNFFRAERFIALPPKGSLPRRELIRDVRVILPLEVTFSSLDNTLSTSGFARRALLLVPSVVIRRDRVEEADARPRCSPKLNQENKVPL